MAILTITDVIFKTKVSPTAIELGETCAKYDLVYQDSDDLKYYLANCGALATASPTFLLLTGGDDEDYAVAVPIHNEMTFEVTGPTLTIQDIIVLSATDGKMALLTDLVSTNILTIIGVADSADTLLIPSNDTGVPKP